jgi:hypothetical protein
MLCALVDSRQIVLRASTLLQSEYQRNRSKTVSAIVDQIKKATFSQRPPVLTGHWSSATAFVDALQDTHKAHRVLVAELEEKASAGQLDADVVIASLFSKTTWIAHEPYLAAARARHELGMPPGKSSHLGDEVHWECLLAEVPPNSALMIVSDDGDFRDVLTGQIKAELATEWVAAQKGSVELYTTLSAFTDRYFKSIKDAADVRKHVAIQALEQTWSFKHTHAAVRRSEPTTCSRPTKRRESYLRRPPTNRSCALHRTKTSRRSWRLPWLRTGTLWTPLVSPLLNATCMGRLSRRLIRRSKTFSGKPGHGHWRHATECGPAL